MTPTLCRAALIAPAAVAALLALPGAASAGGCGGAVRFQPGTDHATLSGRIAGDAVCDFTLRAGRGQVLSADLKAPNGVEAIVLDPVEHTLAPGAPLVLPQDATYTVRVLQTRNAARQPGARDFALKLRVAAAGAQAPAPAAKSAAASGTICEGSGTLTGGQANVSGQLAGDGICTYTLTARAGQTATLLLDAPAGVELWLRAAGADTATPVLPEQPLALAAGENVLSVGRTRNDARKGGSRDFSAVVTVE